MESKKKIIDQIKKGNLSILDNQVFMILEDQLKQVLKDMLEYNPNKRISSKDLLIQLRNIRRNKKRRSKKHPSFYEKYQKSLMRSDKQLRQYKSNLLKKMMSKNKIQKMNLYKKVMLKKSNMQKKDKRNKKNDLNQRKKYLEHFKCDQFKSTKANTCINTSSINIFEIEENNRIVNKKSSDNNNNK